MGRWAGLVDQVGAVAAHLDFKPALCFEVTCRVTPLKKANTIWYTTVLLWLDGE